jgi:hypothetical protein
MPTQTNPAPPPNLADTDPDPAADLELLCAGDHPATPVDWLWPDRIAYGKVTLLAGDPGLGKSLLALDVAAHVTRAIPWPDHTNAEGGRGKAEGTLPNSFPPPSPLPLPPSDPGSVLILSAADTLSDTIRPRLDAAGADPNRVYQIPSITDLCTDFAQLRAAVDRIGDCRLIIVDPVNAFVGPGDSHFHTVVRRVLTPLVRLAQEKHIAILAVTQFRKNDSAAIHRAAGSTGFVSTARSLWTVCHDPRDPDRNLLLPLKQNLAPAARGLAYRITQTPGALAPHLTWEPETETPTTEQAFARPKPPRPPSPERLAARGFLQTALAAGPRPARDVIDEGERRGFLVRTLRRAFHELDGHTEKQGLHRGWWWSLTTSPDGDPPTESAVPFEGVTYQDDVAEQQSLEASLPEIFETPTYTSADMHRDVELEAEFKPYLPRRDPNPPQFSGGGHHCAAMVGSARPPTATNLPRPPTTHPSKRKRRRKRANSKPSATPIPHPPGGT